MARFVFRQRQGTAVRPVEKLASEANRLGAHVLAKTDAMLLVEGSEEMFKALAAGAPDYVSAPETRSKLPVPPRRSAKRRA